MDITSSLVWFVLANLIFVSAQNGTSKIRLTLGYITGSRKSEDDLFYDRPGQAISGAITLAIDEVNDDPDILPDHSLDFLVAETYGKELMSIRQTALLIQRKVSVIIGPQETCNHEAKLAAAFNVPMISYFCTDPALSNRSEYPTFARTKPHDSQLADAVITLLLQYDTRNVVILFDEDERTLARIIEKMLKRERISVAEVVSFNGLAQYMDRQDFPRIVSETKHKTRAYLLVTSLPDNYRLFLLELQTQTSGSHVTLGVNPRQYDTRDPQKYTEGYFKSPRELSDAEIEAFGHFLMVLPSPPIDPSYDAFTEEVNKYLELPPFYFANPFNGVSKIIRPEAAYLYDAVWLYARAAHKAIQAGQNVLDGRTIIQHLTGVPYKSVMGFNVRIDSNGDITGNYTILSLQMVDEEFGMYPAAIFVEDLGSRTGKWIHTGDNIFPGALHRTNTQAFYPGVHSKGHLVQQNYRLPVGMAILLVSINIFVTKRRTIISIN